MHAIPQKRVRIDETETNELHTHSVNNEPSGSNPFTMTGMRTRTKLSLALAAFLFVLFGLGISGPGQKLLIGKPSADHWVRDDQYMGAALAPLVYCLAPAIILASIGAGFYLSDRRRMRHRQSSVSPHLT